jgi:hypothetical protein
MNHEEERRRNMASIEIILRDDHGNVINQNTRKRYVLCLGQNHLSELEEAVEGFKRESLTDMTYDLLAHAQQQQIDQIKKTNR